MAARDLFDPDKFAEDHAADLGADATLQAKLDALRGLDAKARDLSFLRRALATQLEAHADRKAREASAEAWRAANPQKRAAEVAAAARIDNLKRGI